MTVMEQVRAIALLLPETAERATADGADFLVEGKVFACVIDGAPALVRVRDPAGEATITLNENVDWVLVEDRIARS